MRPTHAIALAIASLPAAGCPWGACGDLSFTDRDVEMTFALAADGTVTEGYGDPIDPSAEGACEALCEVAAYVSSVTDIPTCELTVSPAADAGDTDDFGTATVVCVVSGEDECVGGRHHADLGARPVGRGATAAGAWLAREAQGEAGSVIAFRRLARELEAHGAPVGLVARARRAAQEEVGHARAVARLARARGGVVARVRAGEARARPLVELALENAVEACVGETFAAAMASLQAARAQDADVRDVAAAIAPEEARHAELAADLHAWALATLPGDEAARVEGARRAAWQRLARDAEGAPAAVCAALGLPDAQEARALATRLATHLGALG